MKGCGRSGAVVLDALTSLAGFNVFAYVVAHRGPEIVTTNELMRLPASRVSGGGQFVAEASNSSVQFVVVRDIETVLIKQVPMF